MSARRGALLGLAAAVGLAGTAATVCEPSGDARASGALGRLDVLGGLDTLAFGDVLVGQARLRPVLVVNPGPADAVVTGISVTGDGLSVDPDRALPAPLRLQAGARAWFAVRFAPAQAGDVAGAVTVVGDAGPLVQLPIAARGVDYAGYVDVTAAPFGARGDGVTDDTAAFRAAAATGKPLLVPATAAHYRLTGVVEIRNSVVGQGMPLVRMYGANADRGNAAQERFIVFKLKGYQGPGALVSGLHLDGQWDGTGKPGQEYAHLLMIQNSSRVRVENNVLENARGDGVLVGGEPGTPPCHDVTVSGNLIRNPYRCDVAVVSVDTMTVSLNRLEKTQRYYQGAIDVEPNGSGNGDTTWNVEIAFNDFAVAADNGVLLGQVPGQEDPPGGHIRVHDNRGAVGPGFNFFVAPPDLRFQDVQVQDNAF